jgi:arabinose-5-phosphate isomerase
VTLPDPLDPPPPPDDGHAALPPAEATLDLARRVLETEAHAIRGVIARLDDRFVRAVALVAECRGRVIPTGMGKSGIISRKLAATLSSTGTPAFFLHPAEAIHGDLGMIQPSDVVVALSQSGETVEILRLLEFIRRIGTRLVAITGDAQSTLGQAADVMLDCHVDAEACPMNLAPTASTTAALALGDALAMAVLVRKGFREEDFASLHPGGRIGKRLMRAEALMHGDAATPLVRTDTPMRDVIYEMSRKGLGMTCVTGEDGRLAGIITDGDLRRHMDTPDILSRRAADVMTPSPCTVPGSMLAVEALSILEARKISSLIVVDGDRRVRGVLHLHDLWRTELF